MSDKTGKKKLYKKLGLDLYPLGNHNTMTGQKGSGKTTLAMLYVMYYLAAGKVVFTNFRLFGAWFIAAAVIAAGGKERFFALPYNQRLDITREIRNRCFRFDEWDDLYQVKPRRVPGGNPEDQFLCVYDEASIRLNSRTWSDRTSASKAKYGHAARETQFFSQGRKLGFTMLVISQSMQSLDNQFRQQAGYQIHLRNLQQQGYYGIRLPFHRMLAIYHWGETKTVMKRKLFAYPKWVGTYYDSWELFDGSSSFGLRYQFDPDIALAEARPELPAPSPEHGAAEVEPVTELATARPASVLPFDVGEQVSQDELLPWERVVIPPVQMPDITRKRKPA